MARRTPIRSLPRFEGDAAETLVADVPALFDSCISSRTYGWKEVDVGLLSVNDLMTEAIK